MNRYEVVNSCSTQIKSVSKLTIEAPKYISDRTVVLKFIHRILSKENNVQIQWLSDDCSNAIDYITIKLDGSVYWSNVGENKMEKIGHLSEDGEIVLHDDACLL